MGGGMGGMGAGGMGDTELKTVLQISFYLALLFCVGASVTAVMENPPKPRKKKSDIEVERDIEVEDDGIELKPNDNSEELR